MHPFWKLKIREKRNLTLGRSLRWLASKRSSSRLLAYLIMSSGTWDKLQWRLSIYSTCRLHPLNNGIHLNIVVYVRFYLTATPFIGIAAPLSNGNQTKIDTFLNTQISRQITLQLALISWSPFWFHGKTVIVLRDDFPVLRGVNFCGFTVFFPLDIFCDFFSKVKLKLYVYTFTACLAHQSTQ